MTIPLPYGPPAPTGDGKMIARMVLLILGSFAAIIDALVFGLIWAITVSPSGWIVVVVLSAMTLGFVCPVLLFGIQSSWTFQPSKEGSAYLARWFWSLLGVEALCVVATVIAGVLSHPAIWLPITTVTLIVAFTVVGFFLGRALRSAPPPPVDLALDAWRAPRAGLWFWWVVVGIFVLLAGTLFALFQPWAQTVHGAGSTAVLTGYVAPLEFGAFGAGFACIIRYLVVALSAQLTGNRSFVVRQRITRAIFRSAPIELSPTELEFARRNALVLQVSLSWQVGWICFLYFGLILEQFPLLSSSIVPGPLVLAVLFVVLVVGIAILVRYIGKAKRFLSINGQPTGLASGVAPAV